MWYATTPFLSLTDGRPTGSAMLLQKSAFEPPQRQRDNIAKAGLLGGGDAELDAELPRMLLVEREAPFTAA
jgi:hypothetical protein